jgi:hypothetical protein
MDPFAPSTAEPPHLLSAFYRMGLPATYLVLDVETSGNEPAWDLAVGIGSLQVMGDHIIAGEHRHMNWYPVLGPENHGRLCERLEKIPDRPNILQQMSNGVEADFWLRHYAAVIGSMPPGTPVVGHGLATLQWPVLRNNLIRWCGKKHVMDPILYDLGLWEKAIGAGIHLRQCEAIHEFQSRVAAAEAPGVQWSLRYCMDRYQVEPRVPEDDKEYRLRALHLIYQAHRRAAIPWL